MVKPRNEYVASAINYAEGVVGGDILACSYVRLACKRFLADLERDDLYLDQDAVRSFCAFNEESPHVKGKWAAKRERLQLPDWQRFVDCNIFGLKRRSDGLRKYEEVYLEVPRKNGKSFRMAVLAVYMTVLDGEFGAETYCLATTEKQAHEVFVPAQRMLRLDEEMRQFTELDVRAKTIIRKEDGSQFRPLIGDPPDGSSPTCAIIDEYHEHTHDRALTTMQTGMGARDQPLLVIITTAGDNIAGPCYEKRQEVVDILQGTTDDDSADSTFGVIYTIDTGEKADENFWKSEQALRMANPNYDVSVSGRFLKKQQAKAIRQLEYQNTFKTKHLNIWVHQAHPWLNMDRWLSCADASVSLAAMEDLPCCIGFDFGSKVDFAAASVVFYDFDDDEAMHYYVVPYFWLPRKRFERVADYQKWAPYITVTDGEEIDTARIISDLKRLLNRLMVEQVVFDPWRSVGIEQHIEGESYAEIVRMPQTIAHYTAPMYEVQAAVESGRIHYAPNPVLSWMAGNLTCKRDENDNVKPIRPGDRTKKIDGAVAMIEAISQCGSEFSYDGYDGAVAAV